MTTTYEDEKADRLKEEREAEYEERETTLESALFYLAVEVFITDGDSSETAERKARAELKNRSLDWIIENLTFIGLEDE